jgi:hypothetical protein
MRGVELDRALLGLTAPWTVADVEVDMKGQRSWPGWKLGRGRTRAARRAAGSSMRGAAAAPSTPADGARVFQRNSCPPAASGRRSRRSTPRGPGGQSSPAAWARPTTLLIVPSPTPRLWATAR